MESRKCEDCYYNGICDDETKGVCTSHLDKDVDSDIEKIDEYIYREGLKHRQQAHMNLTEEQDDD